MVEGKKRPRACASQYKVPSRLCPRDVRHTERVLMSCSNICGRAILEPAGVGYATFPHGWLRTIGIVCDSNEIRA